MAAPSTHERRATAAAFAICVWVSGPATSALAKPAPCSGGRFLVVGAPQTSGGASLESRTVVLAGGQALVADCGAAQLKLKATRHGTRVRAKWPSCGDRGRVRLKGTIDHRCEQLTGTLASKKGKVRFDASLSRCGDGRMDDGASPPEECDGAPCAGGRACTSECACLPAPTTSTTSSSSTSSRTVSTTTTTSTLTREGCGNGMLEPGEQCDDGNAIETHGCRVNCMLPACGDLVVNQPSEECDEPNGVGGDLPSENCYRCKLNVCGDGFRDTQVPAIEECDDGNTIAGDGCTHCTYDSTLCGANGLAVILTLDYPAQVLGGARAAALELAYPETAAIPESGTSASVQARVTTLLPSGFVFVATDMDTNADDVDDVVRVEAQELLKPIEPGPFARIVFDCAVGAPMIPTEFPCTIPDLIGQDGLPFPPALQALASCVRTFGPGP